MRGVWIGLLIVGMTLPAWATVRPTHQVILGQTIERLGGRVKMLLPCNFIPGRAPTLTGFKWLKLTPAPLPTSSAQVQSAPTGPYLDITISEPDREGLNELHVGYHIEDRRTCADESAVDSLSQ